jgi:hypothetical protein
MSAASDFLAQTDLTAIESACRYLGRLSVYPSQHAKNIFKHLSFFSCPLAP